MFLPLVIVLLAQEEGLWVLVLSARDDAVFLAEVLAGSPDSRGLLRLI